MLSPLRVVDSASDQTLKACLLDEFDDILGLSELRKSCGLNFDISAADRASANNSVEAGMSAHFPAHLRLRLPCVAHIASTSQGRAYNVASTLISNVIAASLAQRPAGAVDKLRDAIADVLGGSVYVHDAPPPGARDPRTLYRDALLAATIPETWAVFDLVVSTTPPRPMFASLALRGFE